MRMGNDIASATTADRDPLLIIKTGTRLSLHTMCLR